MTVTEPTAPHEIAAARRLFHAYGEYLASAGIDVCLTGLHDEMAALPGSHIAPDGILLLASTEPGETIGCVALKKRILADGEPACELKRLYVMPSGRGTGAGRSLMQASFAWARAQGCCSIVLDTHPQKMPEARALYRSMGFEPIPRFNDNPVPEIEFLRLLL